MEQKNAITHSISGLKNKIRVTLKNKMTSFGHFVLHSSSHIAYRNLMARFDIAVADTALEDRSRLQELIYWFYSIYSIYRGRLETC